MLRSDDEFATFTAHVAPGSMGRVAMSADDPDNFAIFTQGPDSRVCFTADGGATFALASAVLPTGVSFDGYALAAGPGVAGEPWASLDEAGLDRSVDGGETFARVGGIARALTVGFGRGEREGDPTVVYVYGEADGREGLLYSEDSGATSTAVSLGTTWSTARAIWRGTCETSGACTSAATAAAL